MEARKSVRCCFDVEPFSRQDGPALSDSLPEPLESSPSTSPPIHRPTSLRGLSREPETMDAVAHEELTTIEECDKLTALSTGIRSLGAAELMKKFGLSSTSFGLLGG
jgi:hypothetical protein